MDASRLSNQQLFNLVKDERLQAAIRQCARSEFENRNLSPETKQALITEWQLRFSGAPLMPLAWKYKILLVLFPFFLVVQLLVSSRFILANEQRKFRDYWRFVSLGLLLWTVILILTMRYFK